MGAFFFGCIIIQNDSAVHIREGALMGLRGEVFSCKATTDNGKRTYFFNVKENRQGDLFLNVVESKPHGGTGYERHSIVVFEEDMELFSREMQKSLDYIRKHKGH